MSVAPCTDLRYTLFWICVVRAIEAEFDAQGSWRSRSAVRVGASDFRRSGCLSPVVANEMASDGT